jgi:hypothetical protein
MSNRMRCSVSGSADPSAQQTSFTFIAAPWPAMEWPIDTLAKCIGQQTARRKGMQGLGHDRVGLRSVCCSERSW